MTSETNQQKRLGDFEIIRELGRGGMGIVYEARQRSLNRKVALKVLSSGLGMTSKAVIRFRREAETAAKLHHTNIVPIHATGEEDGTHFYAMELVDGPSLNLVIRDARDRRRMRPSDNPASNTGPLATESTVDATATHGSYQASLEETATRLPEWVERTMTFDTASTARTSKISVGESSSTITAGHGYFDSVARMMADVADALDYAHSQGVVHRDMKPSNLLLSPDGRLSINDFGLARMLEQPGMTTTGEFMGSPLYMSPEQITAGRAPLDHRTDIYSLGATLYELLTLQPPFLGDRRDQVIAQIMHKEPRSPRSVNKKVPIDLETICLKAMEKDPDRRYQTAGEMAEDLRRFVNRFAISARRVGVVGRASKWVRRHRALSTLAGFAIVVTIAATYFAYRGWVVEQRYLREQAMDEALTAAMSGDLAEATKQIRKAETHGAQAAWVLMLAGQVDLFRGETEAAVEKLVAAVRQDPDIVAAQSMLAYAYLMNGDYTEYTKRVAAMDALSPVTPEDYLFQGRALVHFSPSRGIAAMTKAIEQRPSSHIARILRADAQVFLALDQGKVEHILEVLEDVRAIRSYVGDNVTLGATALYARLGAVRLFRLAGKTEQAHEHLRQAAKEVERLADHTYHLIGNFLRLYYYVFTDQIGEIRRVMREALTRGQAGFLVEPYAIAMFHAGQTDEAVKFLDQFPDQEDVFIEEYRAMLLMDTPEGRTRAKKTCGDFLQRDLQNDMMTLPVQVLFLLGESDKAVEAARNYLPDILLSKHWEFPRDRLRYLGDLISEDEYLEKAGNSARDWGCADYEIALRRLARGDRSGAREHFEKAAASPVFHWGPIGWSRVFAARMARDPEWPNWLPSNVDEGAEQTHDPATVDGGDD